ncbi:uncharacterized protein V6R79_005302 [Siganus canaliculatus]
MSVTFKSKSEEVKEDTWNLMAPNHRWQSRSSLCWIVAAAVGAGLLLLTVILVAQNTSAINQWETRYRNLTQEIAKDRDRANDEHQLLKTQYSNLTNEMETLLRRNEALAASRDKLQEMVTRLNTSNAGKLCRPGWSKFNDKCYYFSASGATRSWQGSRKDCQGRGADLVIITTREELNFVKKTYDVTWIGLSRVSDQWKWVDGNDMVNNDFWQPGEPNNSDGEEDCAEVSRSASAFNDVPCSRQFSWACEDKLL